MPLHHAKEYFFYSIVGMYVNGVTKFGEPHSDMCSKKKKKSFPLVLSPVQTAYIMVPNRFLVFDFIFPTK